MVLVHHMRPSGYSWFSTTELMFLTGKHLTRQETFKKTFFINIFRRCNPEPSYSFTGCVRESLSKMIGCKLKWDSWTSDDVPICQHLDQYRLVSSKSNVFLFDSMGFGLTKIPMTQNTLQEREKF